MKKVREKSESEKNKSYTEAIAIVTALGQQPDEEVDSWQTEGFELYFTELPKMYNWRETYCDSPTSEMGQVLENSQQSNQKDICQQKDKYNSLIRKYISMIKEVAQIDTMINNLDDSKKYQLSIKQATLLGF